MVEMNAAKRTVEENTSIPKMEPIFPTPVASPHYQPDDEIPATSTVDIPSTSAVVRTSRRRTATKSYDFVDDDMPKPKRPRGRPPKTEPTIISPSEYKKLNAADRRYFELRNKNNEASRRSRLNKKFKEDAQSETLEKLMKQNAILKAKDAQLEREMKIWQNRVFKLADL